MARKTEDRLESNRFNLMNFDSEAERFYDEWIIKPHIFSSDKIENSKCVSLSADNRLYISLKDEELEISETIFEKDLLPLLGVHTPMKSYLLSTDNSSLLKNFTESVLFENLNGFAFFYSDKDASSRSKEVVGIRSLLAKDGKPIEGLDQDSLNVINKLRTLCGDDDYSIINPSINENENRFQVIIAKKSDTFNPSIIPCVFNDIDLVRFRFKQYGAIYWKEYDSFIILPRNYAKDRVTDFEPIIRHVSHFFTDVDKDEDYSTEYFELNEDNTSSYCLKLLHEDITLNGNYKLSNILLNVRNQLDLMRATKTKREKVYRCLGLLVAMKHRCCEKCRHLDTSLI